MKRHGIIVRPEGDLAAAFNPAATKFADNKFFLLVRSVPAGYQKIGPVNAFDNDYKSRLSLWEGTSPLDFTLVDSKAIMPDAPFDSFGAEDPRITKIGDTYYICYTSIAIGLGEPNANDGIRIALASTKDFKTFKKHGVIGPNQRSKAGVIFESAGKLHFMWKDEKSVERTMISPVPENFEDASAWQEQWTHPATRHKQLLGPQDNAYEGFGVEPGAPPIEIPEGLLTVYSSISADFKWTISIMLLDKNDPSRIIAKTDKPILIPEEDYEKNGDVPNVVFPCGALIENDRLYVYYGCADTVCAVASESMDNIRKLLKPFTSHPAAPQP